MVQDGGQQRIVERGRERRTVPEGYPKHPGEKRTKKTAYGNGYPPRSVVSGLGCMYRPCHEVAYYVLSRGS